MAAHKVNKLISLITFFSFVLTQFFIPTSAYALDYSQLGSGPLQPVQPAGTSTGSGTSTGTAIAATTDYGTSIENLASNVLSVPTTSSSGTATSTGTKTSTSTGTVTSTSTSTPTSTGTITSTGTKTSTSTGTVTSTSTSTPTNTGTVTSTETNTSTNNGTTTTGTGTITTTPGTIQPPLDPDANLPRAPLIKYGNGKVELLFKNDQIFAQIRMPEGTGYKTVESFELLNASVLNAQQDRVTMRLKDGRYIEFVMSGEYEIFSHIDDGGVTLPTPEPIDPILPKPEPLPADKVPIAKHYEAIADYLGVKAEDIAKVSPAGETKNIDPGVVCYGTGCVMRILESPIRVTLKDGREFTGTITETHRFQAPFEYKVELKQIPGVIEDREKLKTQAIADHLGIKPEEILEVEQTGLGKVVDPGIVCQGTGCVTRVIQMPIRVTLKDGKIYSGMIIEQSRFNAPTRFLVQLTLIRDTPQVDPPGKPNPEPVQVTLDVKARVYEMVDQTTTRITEYGANERKIRVITVVQNGGETRTEVEVFKYPEDQNVDYEAIKNVAIPQIEIQANRKKIIRILEEIDPSSGVARRETFTYEGGGILIKEYDSAGKLIRQNEIEMPATPPGDRVRTEPVMNFGEGKLVLRNSGKNMFVDIVVPGGRAGFKTLSAFRLDPNQTVPRDSTQPVRLKLANGETMEFRPAGEYAQTSSRTLPGSSYQRLTKTDVYKMIAVANGTSVRHSMVKSSETIQVMMMQGRVSRVIQSQTIQNKFGANGRLAKTEIIRVTNGKTLQLSLDYLQKKYQAVIPQPNVRWPKSQIIHFEFRPSVRYDQNGLLSQVSSRKEDITIRVLKDQISVIKG